MSRPPQMDESESRQSETRETLRLSVIAVIIVSVFVAIVGARLLFTSPIFVPPTATPTPFPTATVTPTSAPTSTATATATATLIVKIGACPVEFIRAGQREGRLEYTEYNGVRQEIVTEVEMNGDCAIIEILCQELPLDVYEVLRLGGTVPGYQLCWWNIGAPITPVPRVDGPTPTRRPSG